MVSIEFEDKKPPWTIIAQDSKGQLFKKNTVFVSLLLMCAYCLLVFVICREALIWVCLLCLVYFRAFRRFRDVCYVFLLLFIFVKRT